MASDQATVPTDCSSEEAPAECPTSANVESSSLSVDQTSPSKSENHQNIVDNKENREDSANKSPDQSSVLNASDKSDTDTPSKTNDTVKENINPNLENSELDTGVVSIASNEIVNKTSDNNVLSTDLDAAKISSVKSLSAKKTDGLPTSAPTETLASDTEEDDELVLKCMYKNGKYVCLQCNFAIRFPDSFQYHVWKHLHLVGKTCDTCTGQDLDLNPFRVLCPTVNQVMTRLNKRARKYARRMKRNLLNGCGEAKTNSNSVIIIDENTESKSNDHVKPSLPDSNESVQSTNSTSESLQPSDVSATSNSLSGCSINLSSQSPVIQSCAPNLAVVSQPALVPLETLKSLPMTSLPTVSVNVLSNPLPALTPIVGVQNVIVPSLTNNSVICALPQPVVSTPILFNTLSALPTVSYQLPQTATVHSSGQHSSLTSSPKNRFILPANMSPKSSTPSNSDRPRADSNSPSVPPTSVQSFRNSASSSVASRVHDELPVNASPISKSDEVGKQNSQDLKSNKGNLMQIETDHIAKLERSTASSFSKSNRVVFVCGVGRCTFTTGMEISFKSHIFAKHSFESSLLCVYCQSEFMTKELLIEHMKGHFLPDPQLKIFTCFECDSFASNLLSEYRSHYSSSHCDVRRHFCRHCHSVFNEFEELVDHLQKNVLKVHHCAYCRVMNSNRRLIITHINQKHPGKSRQMSSRCMMLCRENQRLAMKDSSTCTACGEITSDSKSLRDHLESCSEFAQLENPRPMSCPDCTVLFKNQLDLVKHIARGYAHHFFSCSFKDCFFTTSKILKFDTHCLEHKKMDENSKIILECSSCDVQSNVRQYLEAHVRYEHRDNRLASFTFSQKEDKDVVKDKNSLLCNKCLVYFVRNEKLNAIHQKHHKENEKNELRREICPVCGEAFNFLLHLYNHVSKTHFVQVTLKLYVCSKCPLRSSNKSVVIDHTKRCHRGKKAEVDILEKTIQSSIVSCPACKFYCHRKEVDAVLTQHIDKMHQHEAEDLKTQLSSELNDQDNVDKVVVESVDGVFSCQFDCTFVGSVDEYRVHLIQHFSGERTFYWYNCGNCAFQSPFAASVIHHCRTTHSRAFKPAADKRIVCLVGTKDVMDKSVDTSATAAVLELDFPHASSSASGLDCIDRFLCDHCSCGFSTRDDYDLHLCSVKDGKAQAPVPQIDPDIDANVKEGSSESVASKVSNRQIEEPKIMSDDNVHLATTDISSDAVVTKIADEDRSRNQNSPSQCHSCSHCMFVSKSERGLKSHLWQKHKTVHDNDVADSEKKNTSVRPAYRRSDFVPANRVSLMKTLIGPASVMKRKQQEKIKQVKSIRPDKPKVVSTSRNVAKKSTQGRALFAAVKKSAASPAPVMSETVSAVARSPLSVNEGGESREESLPERTTANSSVDINDDKTSESDVSLSPFITETKRIDKQVFECSSCKQVFRDIEIGQKHSLEMHNSLSEIVAKSSIVVHKCRACTDYEPQEDVLDVIEHFGFIHNGFTGYICGVCNDLVKSLKSLISHNNVHGKKTEVKVLGERVPFQIDNVFKCPCCTFRNESPSVVSEHLNTEHKPKGSFQCFYCAFNAEKNTDVHSHHGNHHESLPLLVIYHQNREKKLNCPDKQNKIVSALTNQTSAPRDNSPARARRSGAESLTCPKCEKFSTSALKDMRVHIMQHMGYKPFRCNFPGCEVRGFKASGVIKHFKSTHVGEPDVKDEGNDRQNRVLDVTLKRAKLVRGIAGSSSGDDSVTASQKINNRKNKTVESSSKIGKSSESLVEITSYLCMACDFSCGGNYGLIEKHFETAHPKNSVKALPMDAEELDRFEPKVNSENGLEITCTSCNSVFHSHAEYRRHWRCHQVIFWKCGLCSRYLSPDRQRVLLHCRRQHDNSAVIVIKALGSSKKTISNSKDNKVNNSGTEITGEDGIPVERNASGHLMCTKCDFTDGSMEKFKEHFVKWHKPRWRCVICDYKSREKVDMMKHCKEYQTPPHKFVEIDENTGLPVPAARVKTVANKSPLNSQRASKSKSENALKSKSPTKSEQTSKSKSSPKSESVDRMSSPVSSSGDRKCLSDSSDDPVVSTSKLVNSAKRKRSKHAVISDSDSSDDTVVSPRSKKRNKKTMIVDSDSDSDFQRSSRVAFASKSVARSSASSGRVGGGHRDLSPGRVTTFTIDDDDLRSSPPLIESSLKYLCCYCPEKLDTELGLGIHVKNHSLLHNKPNDSSDPIHNAENAIVRYECSGHPYRCTKCSESFCNLSMSRKHVDSVHGLPSAVHALRFSDGKPTHDVDTIVFESSNSASMIKSCLKSIETIPDSKFTPSPDMGLQPVVLLKDFFRLHSSKRNHISKSEGVKFVR